MALGISSNAPELLTLYVAIISHKWIESFALGVSLVRTNKPAISILKLLVIYSLMTPIGILLGYVLEQTLDEQSGETATSCLTAVASGTFIYVALMDIMLEEFKNLTEKYWKLLMSVVGFVAMTCLLLAFSHDHGESGSSSSGSHSH